jgi:tRNA pseudouridine65 synthase
MFFKLNSFSLKIIYQDENFIAINKPSGIIVHPWSECADDTSLMYQVKEITGKWIYPVHRLDRPVSGVILFAFSPESARHLKESLENNNTHKIYISLCMHEFKNPVCNTYELFNQARTKKQQAKTGIIPIETSQNVTLSKVRIFTGRYHQIRRHFSSMGHHLVGDTKYGKGNINRYFREKYNLHRLFLHCVGLKITIFGNDFEFKAELPKDLSSVVNQLKLSYNVDDLVFNSEFDNLVIFSKKLS